MVKEIGELWSKPKAPEVKTPEPRREPHRFEFAVGWCPECKSYEFRPGFEQFPVLKLPELRRAIVDRLRGHNLIRTEGKSYVCRDCGTELADTPEEVRKTIESCPSCGSTQAVSFERFKALHTPQP